MTDQIVLTESSRAKIEAELNHLKTTKRQEIAEAIRKARAFGDLSENFEYHAARRDQGMLNGRITDLEALLEQAVIVADDSHADDTAAGLGMTVTVWDLVYDEEVCYRLVDPVQADPLKDMISIQSPVGRALTGKRVGETIEVPIPAGIARLKITAISRT
ncbi:MAG: transcription elongation factor GreA [Armatimonadetes bacterium]|nr:transcription elongation factor GreA [Armatimonadota bacterium]